MYSFIRNDNNSFSDYSRIYEVYYDNELVTCLVFGLDKTLNKYFICQLGDYVLYNKYNLTENEVDSNKIILSIYEFLNLLFLLEPSDFMIKKGIELPKLSLDNTVIYISDIEPYGIEDLRTPYEYSNYLLDNNIVCPIYYEDLVEDKYKDYDYYELEEDYKETIDPDLSLYCSIDYNKLKLCCKSIH
jgi:hypothetical protein